LNALWKHLADSPKHSEMPIFFGLDMDVIHIVDAPGVSAPNSTGLSGTHILGLAKVVAEHPRTRILEITEVNPAHDIDDRTSRLTAVIVWHFLSTICNRLDDD